MELFVMQAQLLSESQSNLRETLFVLVTKLCTLPSLGEQSFRLLTDFAQSGVEVRQNIALQIERNVVRNMNDKMYSEISPHLLDGLRVFVETTGCSVLLRTMYLKGTFRKWLIQASSQILDGKSDATNRDAAIMLFSEGLQGSNIETADCLYPHLQNIFLNTKTNQSV
jgi:hypothetical protein